MMRMTWRQVMMLSKRAFPVCHGQWLAEARLGAYSATRARRRASQSREPLSTARRRNTSARQSARQRTQTPRSTRNSARRMAPPLLCRMYFDSHCTLRAVSNGGTQYSKRVPCSCGNICRRTARCAQLTTEVLFCRRWRCCCKIICTRAAEPFRREDSRVKALGAARRPDYVDWERCSLMFIHRRRGVQGRCAMPVDGERFMAMSLGRRPGEVLWLCNGSSADSRLQNRSTMLSRVASGAAVLAADTAPWHMMHSRPPASVNACRYSTASFSLHRSSVLSVMAPYTTQAEGDHTSEMTSILGTL